MALKIQDYVNLAENTLEELKARYDNAYQVADTNLIEQLQPQIDEATLTLSKLQAVANS